MTMIPPIGSIPQIPLPERTQAPAQTGGTSGFGATLEAAIHQVESSRTGAAQAVERFLAGESEELHSTALSVQRAELEFELLLQVRNKVVQAYQEIMRMQI